MTRPLIYDDHPNARHLGLYRVIDASEFHGEQREFMESRVFRGIPRVDDEDYGQDSTLIALIHHEAVGPLYGADDFVERNVGPGFYQWNVYSGVVECLIPPLEGEKK